MWAHGGEGEVMIPGERTSPVRGSHLKPSPPLQSNPTGSFAFMSPLKMPRQPRSPRLSLATITLLLASGCAGGLATPPPSGPTVDAEAVAAAARLSNQIPSTAQLTFDWSLREPNLNVSGEGVVRVQPPDHARLDLFMGGGNPVLAVALVADDLRTPRGAPRGVIPSPPLLWAAFGVFRPGDTSVILGAEVVGDRMRIRYRLSDGSELRYYLRETRVVEVEMLIDGELVHQVDLDVPDLTQLPRESTYRNHPSFRELKVAVSAVENRDGFPERTWSPGR
jgi:hypothetical protein